MKRYFLMLLCGITASVMMAQDIVIFRNGDEEEAKVTEVSDTEVRYKKWSNLDGPTIVKKIDDIFMIRYENGTKQTFNTTTTNTTNTVPANQNTIPQGLVFPPGSLEDRMYRKMTGQVDTSPKEGPWLSLGIRVQEGVNFCIFRSDNLKGYSAYRFLPSVEAYAEYAPKQRHIEITRTAVYLGFMYSFRGGKGKQNGQQLNSMMDYFCIRPGVGLHQGKAYLHVGPELGVLTTARETSPSFSGVVDMREVGFANPVTFGIFMDMGGVIINHITLGGFINATLTNLATAKAYNNIPGFYNPNFAIGISVGGLFTMKFDKKE